MSVNCNFHVILMLNAMTLMGASSARVGQGLKAMDLSVEVKQPCKMFCNCFTMTTCNLYYCECFIYIKLLQMFPSVSEDWMIVT